MVCFWVLFFRGGGGGVVVLSGWLTIITLFYIAKVKPSSGCHTLMLTFTIKLLTALSLIVLHTELIHFYNDNLKDTLKSISFT